jgi:phosphatidylglycerophosphate synthase
VTSERFVPQASASRALNGSIPTERRVRSLRQLYHRASAYRGGGDLFTRRVNDPLGSWVAAVALRFGVHPTVITLTDLGLALTASAFVITRADSMQSLWLPGLVALVVWQLSFILDCADGQVARAAGKTSSFGARVDALVDFSVHATVICTLLTVAVQRTNLPVPVLLGCAILWPLGLLVYALARSDGNEGHSFVARDNRVFTAVKLIRDTGFILLVTGLWLSLHPQSIIIPVAVISAYNACFLVASIGREAYLSLHGG